MAALNGEMVFGLGEQVEVASQQEGFRGSFYEGTVVGLLKPVKKYVVKYDTLITDDDLAAPLTETATVAEVRPRLPEIRMKNGDDFEKGDLVDAFDNDGWWVGVITGKDGDKFSVYFDYTEEEIEYARDRVRVHFDWNHDRLQWVDPMKRKNLIWSW